MPDFFYGKPLPQSVFPLDTDEKKKALGDFLGGPAAPPASAAKVPELVKKLGDKYSEVKNWGSVGMCWGGKVGLPNLFSLSLSYRRGKSNAEIANWF